MRRIICILFTVIMSVGAAVAFVGCSPSEVSPEVREFADNIGDYEGKIVYLNLTLPSASLCEAFWEEPVLSLKDAKGKKVFFVGQGQTKKGDTDMMQQMLFIHIVIPDDLEVPNVLAGEKVVVGFLCEEGAVSRGNVATSVKRL